MKASSKKEAKKSASSVPASEAEKTQAFLNAMKFVDVLNAARDEALEWNEVQQQSGKAKRKKKS